MLRTAAIVPVKRFDLAKTRLDLPGSARARLCGLMLREVLGALSASPEISRTFVVTGDAEAARAARTAGAAVVRDGREEGVNEAVGLAAGPLREWGASASLVIPQDVPLVEPADISALMRTQMPPDFVTVVPSRRFDGTNALLRMPPDAIETSYDRDSYRAHMASARRRTANASVVFVPRIMQDVDVLEDLRSAVSSGYKPGFCRAARELL